MLSKSKLRLVTKVAQLYYEKGYLQKQIAKELHLSQATILRLLKTADEQKIVKTSVSIPVGVYSDMEKEIEDRYGIKEVIIADTPSNPDEEEILRSIGSVAFYYLETTLAKGEVIGISSWSTTLLANSGNIFSEDELNELEEKGAIGDICLHFFDEDGQPIETSLNKRVMSMPLHQIKKVERTIGVAGGNRKVKAIKAAMKGEYINVLITDRFTAEKL